MTLLNTHDITMSDLHSSDHNAPQHTSRGAADADGQIKTALDCDILTLARRTKAAEKAAVTRHDRSADPLARHYRPLGNPDVRTVIGQR